MGVDQSQKPIERSLMRQTEVRGWTVGLGQSQTPIVRSFMRQTEVRDWTVGVGQSLLRGAP